MSGSLSIGQRAPKVKARSKPGSHSNSNYPKERDGHQSKSRSQFRFTKIPNSLLYPNERDGHRGRLQGGRSAFTLTKGTGTSRLSDGANLTLQQILGRDFEDGNGRRKGYVLASIGELARARWRCTRTIRNHLKELLQKGYLLKIEGRRIYINYERLGNLRRNFTIIPNRLFALDLPDGVKLTLECLLKEGSLKLDRRGGLPTQRGVRDGVQVSRQRLAKERGKTSRTIQRHLSYLKAFDWPPKDRVGGWQEATVHGEERAATLALIQEQNDILFHYILTAWLAVENSVALWGKKCRSWWKNLSAPSDGENIDGNSSFSASASPHKTKFKTKIKTNDDTTCPALSLRCPELRRFLESPKEGRRRSLLMKRFGREAFTRALRQADLQYAHSPMKIRNPYGLLWTMLQDLDDTLLRAQEARERKREEEEERRRKARKPEGLYHSPSDTPTLTTEAGSRSREGQGKCDLRRKREACARRSGMRLTRPKSKVRLTWERFVAEVEAERPLLAACLELSEHSFDQRHGVLRLRGDPFIRRSLGAERGYLTAKAAEIFGEGVRGGVSIGLKGEARGRNASSNGVFAEMESEKRSRPLTQGLVLTRAG